MSTATAFFRSALLIGFGFVSLSIHQPAPALEPPPPPPVMVPHIVARYPHDSSAFTQGLFMRDGLLYESTGQRGRSFIRRIRLKDGKVLKSASLPPELFGEGIVDWKDEIINITWQGGVGYRWSIKTLKPTSMIRYPGEGWGLTRDDKQLYFSDGTNVIRVLDPVTFGQIGSIPVKDDWREIDQLNELEFIKGKIYANIWQTNRIAEIDPGSGQVTGYLDLTALEAEVGPKLKDRDSVLNGIAYDAKNGLFLLTGKNWPTLFAVKFNRPAGR